MTVEEIARVCHEVNRAYCLSLGDASQTGWDAAPQWQKDSAINGVKFHLEHKDSAPSDSHQSWLNEKVAAGWKYGPVKDPAKKEHPCCVPYEEIPREQQTKDFLFLAVVRALQPVRSSIQREHILQFFAYGHLPPHLQAVSAPFGDLAERLFAELPRNPERTVALRKLLESKDAAVRATLAKD